MINILIDHDFLQSAFLYFYFICIAQPSINFFFLKFQ